MITRLTDDTFEETLNKDRIAVVKTYATWCGPCKLLKPHFSRWSENHKVYNDVPVSYYEVNNDENRKFIEKYKVSHLPSMLFFIHGIHVFTLRGMTRGKVFEDILRKSLEIKFAVKGKNDVDATEDVEKSGET